MTLKPGPTLLLLPLLCLALPSPLRAQVDTSRTALPDIAPREVEIRGALEISFPSLQRQPLVGFNPPPRVPNVPDGRRPFVEGYGKASADLPTSPLRRPQPPSALSGAAYPPARGLVEASGGRYYSRAVHAHVSGRLGEHTALLTRLDYRGSDGHRPFDDKPDARSSFDAAEGGIGIQHTGTRWAVGGEMEGSYESFRMYGAGDVLSASPLPYLAQPERTGQSGAGAFRLRSVAGTAADLRLGLRLSATHYDTRILEGGIEGAKPALTEQRFEADARVSRSIPSGEVWAEGDLSSARLTDDLGTTTSVDGGAGVRLRAGRTLSVTVGARFLGAFSDTDQPREEAENTRIGYLSPDVRLEVVPSTGLRFYARNRPAMEPNTLSDVFRNHPYLVTQPTLRPTLRSVDAEAGVNVFAGPVQLAAQAGYQEMPQYLFFEDEPGVYSRGFTALRYAKAQVFHAGGSLSVLLPAGLYAMVGASYREGSLPDQDDVQIPYFAPVVGEAVLSYSFARSRGLLQITGHYQSPRYRDREHSREVGAFFDVDAEASYNLTRILGVVFRVENIGGDHNERWDHYAAAPLVIGVGLRVFW